MAKKQKQDQGLADALSKIKMVSNFEISCDAFDHTAYDEVKRSLSKIKGITFKEYNPHQQELNNILEYGLSKIVNPEYEYFTGRPQTRREDFIQAIQAFLDRVLKGNSLVIIDPYIFPKHHDSDYITFIIDILKKYTSKLRELIFITSSKHNSPTQKQIFSQLNLLNPKLKITLKQSEHFHDRFWLSPRNRKGIFMGTSLNGLGKKYTLIDYIHQDDVRQILSEVKKIP